ncbi:MAG: hypothetical protein K0S39_3316 [Paenibacillus sp.]|nr:hypothetical protein [Paenibacillus sp.]
MRKKKQVTLEDIARELTLTVHTVSKALRGLPGMSETTRREIFETARRLGYKTKEQELSLGYERIPMLSSKRRRFTMLLTQDTPFFRLQLEGVQERLHELGHSVSVSFIPGTVNNSASLERWIEITDLLYSDGLFIPPALPEFLESSLLRLQLPKVLINYPPVLSNVDSVIWDVMYAIHQSVDHFVSMGHRRILFVGDIHSYRGFRLRWQAFQEAMGLLGMNADPGVHHTAAALSGEQWAAQLKEKLESGSYTAILCAVDHDLAKIVYAVQSLGRSIPEDYALIGLENMGNRQFPNAARPVLLVKEAGYRAAERLLWRLANPDQPFEHIRLQGGFIAGATVTKRGK